MGTYINIFFTNGHFWNKFVLFLILHIYLPLVYENFRSVNHRFRQNGSQFNNSNRHRLRNRREKPSHEPQWARPQTVYLVVLCYFK